VLGEGLRAQRKKEVCEKLPQLRPDAAENQSARWRSGQRSHGDIGGRGADAEVSGHKEVWALKIAAVHVAARRSQLHSTKRLRPRRSLGVVRRHNPGSGAYVVQYADATRPSVREGSKRVHAASDGEGAGNQ